jgi:Flp pilus assembly protein TadG
MKHSLVSRIRRFLVADSEGGALVEMAVTLPLVMIIMTGIVSFSFALYQKLQLAEAVSNAGHYLAVARGDTNPCATAISSIYAAAPGLSSGAMNISLTQNGSALPNSCTGNTLTQYSTVSVLVTYPTSLSVYGMPYSSFNLSQQITEIVQ